MDAPEVQERPRAGTSPDVSQDEINAICHPLTQYAAQVRYLRDVLKLTVARRPQNGAPLVWRAHLDAVARSTQPGIRAATLPAPVGSEPNVAALQQRVAAKLARKAGNGQKA